MRILHWTESFLPRIGGVETLLGNMAAAQVDAGAPVVGVNEHWHECQKPEDVRALVDGLRAKGSGALTGCHLKVGDE